MNVNEPPEPAHAAQVSDVARRLATDSVRGLETAEATTRLELQGSNVPPRARRPDYARIAVRQVVDPLVALLAAAAVVSIVVGESLEAAVIAAIVILNAILGFFEEAGAERAVLALRRRAAALASVVRDGRERQVDAADIVSGDIVVLREGDRVPADARVADARGLAVDEALLTGESFPADKAEAAVPRDAPLGDRSSMVFAGTAVARGRGRAIVVATGGDTELGAVARLTETAVPPTAPLARRIQSLARLMVAAGLVITVALTAGAWLHGADVRESFLIGVSVAVAAVPEGLAATLTIALALGARRMAARGAIVQRLSAIETVGETTVICADKTGTLTQNRLRLEALALADGRRLPLDADASRDVDARALLHAAALASTADLARGADGERPVGDPVDVAVVVAAREAGFVTAPREPAHELPFDAERRRMTVVYDGPEGRESYTKGAHEVLFDRATHMSLAGREQPMTPESRGLLDRAARDLAADGLRVIAVGRRHLPPGAHLDDAESGITLLGLIGLVDPLRPEAAESVRQARAAGLASLILTGDHPNTAEAVARALGIPDPRPMTGADIADLRDEEIDDVLRRRSVFARVTPADKLRLVRALQARGEVVAVTGDGVNDAPALRQADVGIAMGRSGTAAAREASAMVLTDDNFATIVEAVREGRTTAANVRKFVAFLLSANLGEVVLFGIAVLGGLGAPMSVVQVLIVNLLTDGLPAVALARDPAAPGPMGRDSLGPRLFTAAQRATLGLAGVAVGLVSLAAFLVGREIDGSTGQTMAFATLALSELAFVFSCRSPDVAAWRGPRNVWLAGSVAASFVVVALAIYLPGAGSALGTTPLDPTEGAFVLGLSAIPFALVEFVKAARRGRRRTAMTTSR